MDNRRSVLLEVCIGKTSKFDLMGTLSSRSSVMFHLDNDGDLDIVTNDYGSEPMVLISDLAQVKQIHRLKVVLEGIKSNRQVVTQGLELNHTLKIREPK